MSPKSQSLRPILGFGSGGHCKVVIEIIRRLGVWEISGLLDTDESRAGEIVGGVPVLGNDDMAAKLFAKGIRTAFVGIGSIGSTESRRNVFSILRGLGFELPVLVHPSASVAFDTMIGPGTCLMPGVIVNPGACIGESAILNSGSIIEHDCRISSFVHISPGATLGGDVHVGDGTHVGIGAVIRQGIQIGKNAIIGAGAVVVKDVEDGATVIGQAAVPRSCRQ
jgi:UDP-perosamine 4-acetyltransferase